VMWAASDFTAENGATRFLPGSNHWQPSLTGYGSKTGPSLPAGFQSEDALQAVMPKGSVALWSGHTLHGAGSYERSVTPAGPRHGLLFIYNLGWLRSEHNFHWAVPRAVLQSLSPALKSLIGLDGENAVEHDWYTGPVYAQPYLGGPEGNASGDGVQLKTMAA
ncbi:ausE, partial [Symbiodinium necroappetens]